MKKRWVWPSSMPLEVMEALGPYPQTERTLLYRRNIRSMEEAAQFLEEKDESIPNPFLLADMDRAVGRISEALRKDEQVVIYGDYDADGITATALLMECMERIGLRTRYYIPHRMKEGYGLHKKSLGELREGGADLIITVDCGIRSVEEVEWAKSLGMDLIVTDHHEPGDRLPGALSILNPKRDGDGSPFKELAGVGLAFLLANALMNDSGIEDTARFEELLAIGTISDLAPLVGVNRLLVARGLRMLGDTPRPGIRSLLKHARFDGGDINADTVGFGLGPRINAAGRLEDASKAVELLITRDPGRASELAAELDDLNRRRRSMTNEIVEIARSLVGEREDLPEIIFAAHSDLHEGIVGLAASRISEEYYRPAIVATLGENFTRGSARSIPGFHITNALDECADILEKYGGHEFAAGFTVATNDIETLQQRLEEIASEQLRDVELLPEIEIDVEVPFSELDHDLLEFVEKLEPCGIGNPSPMFATREVKVLEARAVGKKGSHLKMTLQRDRRVFDAIAFRLGHVLENLRPMIDVAFHFERNLYMGVESLQLNVKDIRNS